MDENANPAANAAPLPGPFEVYSDYEGGLHVIDGTTRIVLSDSYAYDASPEARVARMEWIAAALTAASLILPDSPSRGGAAPSSSPPPPRPGAPEPAQPR